MARAKSAPKESTANIGFEAKLWLAADKLRNNMDAAEYKHVVLGLIFLKYISDSFEEHHAKLTAGKGDYAGANPEDPDEYRAENVFWVPADARWSHLQANAKQPSIGKTVDDAMVAIERQTFETLDCISPPANLTTAFDRAVGPLLSQIRANLHQSRTLATLRDTLLPKLLSGESSVAGLESKVEAAS